MVRPQDRNQSQNIKIDIRACSDSELYDAFCDLSYAFFLLECPESPARKAYGISCGPLTYRIVTRDGIG